MASGTAYYNLRKDASTDNYNVAVVNQNLDDIDAQMHQNEVAATTPFTGATSSANGEKGIVPRPMAGDKENFLCGDGTWKPVQGGGGSTVTITPTLATGRKIAEYEIDGTNGSLFAPLVEITGEASGSIATFTDGADGKPVKNLVIDIEPVQSGSGDPSPENVRPISGWSGANVTRCGKNLFNIDNVDTIVVSDTGAERNGVFVKGNGEFYISVNAETTLSADYMYVRVFNSDRTIKTTYNVISGTTIAPAGFSLSNGEYFALYDATGNVPLEMSIAKFERWKPQIEIGAQATTYSPYQGSTTSIPFHDSSDNPITVYGGTLNVTSGELTVTMASVDLGTLNYGLSTERYPRFTTTHLANIKAPTTVNDLLNGVCEVFDIKTAAETYNGVIGLSANENGELRIYAPTYSDIETFKTAMNGVQLVYELATPQTYQLTPAQVSTMLGQNNIFADCGDVEEVVYVRDINLAFNQLEARVAALEGSNSRSVSVSLTKSAPIEETKEETKEEEPNEVKEKEEKR